MADLPPKNVCPKCGERSEFEQVQCDVKLSAYLKPVRCTKCGEVIRLCDRRHYTPDEKEAVRIAKCAREREMYRANHEKELQRRREYRSRPEVKVRERQRSRRLWAENRDDPEYRERDRAASLAYYYANAERLRRKNREYQQAHRYELALKKKRWRLEKLRAEKERG